MYNEILHHKNKVFAVLLLRHKLLQVCLCWSTNNSNENNEKTISISIFLYLPSEFKFLKNVVALLFRRFNQWSLSFILSEKLCTSHWKIMPRLFHFLQKILENCKCTTSKCLIHSSLGLQAIYSAIIHGPIPKLSLVPYIPSNGTKRTQSFFGKSFPIIALWENQIDSQIKRHFFLTKKGVKVTFQTIVSDCNISNNEPVSKIHFLTFCLSWMNCSYYLFLFFFIQCVPMTQMPSPEDH